MTCIQTIRVVHLFDVPELAATLEDWFIHEWAPWYGPGGQGDAHADLAACHDRNALPICLVALNVEGEPLGTAALKAQSAGSELGVGPWLAAVLVHREHREKGVGSLLVEAIENEAERLGFDAIYTSTDVAMAILERRGWRPFGRTGSIRGPLTVYQFQIEGKSAP